MIFKKNGGGGIKNHSFQQTMGLPVEPVNISKKLGVQVNGNIQLSKTKQQQNASHWALQNLQSETIKGLSKHNAFHPVRQAW